MYRPWSDEFGSYDCVIDPPKTQGIAEVSEAYHNELQARTRVDGIVKNLFLSKKSKYRQIKIVNSRKKTSSEKKHTKESLPTKIVTEKWKKKKQSKGPGFFQVNKKTKVKAQRHEWENIVVIPWGGEYRIPDSLFSDFESIQMTNTCTIDNFLQIVSVFYSLNIDQMQRLFSSDHPLVGKVAEVVQLLLTDDNQAAKYIWLSQICNLSSDRNGLIDAFENDKQKTMYPLRDIFRRRYTYSKCSSKHCPLNSLDVNTDEISDVTLHNPDKVDVDDKLSQSIKEWELGTSTKNLVSCKTEFSGEPDHSNYICQEDGDRLVVRCSVWRNPMNLHFLQSHQF